MSTRQRPSSTSRWVLLAFAAATLAGCRGSEGGPAGTPTTPSDQYVDAMTRDFDPGRWRFEESEAECISKVIVDAVGVPALKSAGVTADNIPGFGGDTNASLLGPLEPDDAAVKQIASQLPTCINMAQVALAWLNRTDQPSEALDCIETRLNGDSTFSQGMVLSILGTGSDVANGIVPVFVLTVTDECHGS